MPRFSKYNDAVRYDLRWKSQTFTQKTLNDLCDKIAQTSGYRMVVYDTFGEVWNKEAPIVEKIQLPEGWEDW